MKKLLILLLLVPILSFAQINIELESHNFTKNGFTRSSCFYGVSAYEDGQFTLVLNLKNIVKVEVRNGQNKEVYTISQDGIYDINIPMANDNFIIVFTDWQGTRLWWYRY
jgi:hypothetical protein